MRSTSRQSSALAAHAFLDGAEEIGAVAPHPALVDKAGQAARTRQYGQQREFGQRHRAHTIVGEDDLVAGQREFVTTAGAGALDGGDPDLAGMGARVFQAVAGLVGELAEVDLVSMRGATQHLDVGAGAEDARVAGVHDHAADVGMFEAQALRVVGFDVDTEVVGIELEFVTLAEGGLLVHREAEPGDTVADVRVQWW